jgi:hypothetical protein
MRAIIGQSAPLVRARPLYPVLQRAARMTGSEMDRVLRPQSSVLTCHNSGNSTTSSIFRK